MDNELPIVTTQDAITGEQSHSNAPVDDIVKAVTSDSAPEPIENPVTENDKSEKKVPPGVQKRFGEYSRKVAERDAQIADLQAQLDARSTQPETQADGEPNPTEYLAGEYDPAYLKAVRAWDKEQLKLELKSELATESTAQSQANAFNELEANYANEHSDYIAVRDSLLENEVVNDSESLAAAIFEHDNPAAVMHWLGQNIEEAERIAQLSPIKAAIELGKIDIKPSKNKTSAPRPATPMQTGSSAISTDPNDVPLGDYDKYVEARNKQGANFVRMQNY